MDVLFISKPIAPPFQDGSKCLVRDIATRLERARPMVLTTRGAPALPGVDSTKVVAQLPIYSNSGRHAPSLAENLRAAAWLLTRSRADLWHFVFAPNPRTSEVGRWLSRARNRRVVQTIASPPKRFERMARLLFGDIVVAQSDWTAAHVRAACEREGTPVPDLRVIPPPVPELLTRSRDAGLSARARLDIPTDAPLFVYPGDLEFSSGGRTSLEIARALSARMPEAVVLFAYRRKTESAEAAADALRRAAPSNTRFAATLPDVLALIATASAVIFPVDELFGKVDLPIVLLEAMVLGVPVLALGAGPLVELQGAELLSSLDAGAWVEALVRLTWGGPQRAERIEAQRVGTLARSAAARVARQYEDLYFELANRSAP